ncbi:MAG TPA: xanthine dehydrogenase family protein molybdopterin-binding subunit [Candidatus Limnocylindria bacterium]|nr:xanthine dehydrogenase family protein molybdopterin-binding subunit [Candidatus Limnocylindria bacterium]
MTSVAEAPGGVLAEPEYRVEGRDKVTGAARFAADVAMPGMLHAAFVASPYPHARIVSVDVSAARALPGVRAVLTGADTKPQRFGRRLQDWPVLCSDRALFIGDRVAAVAADTLQIAAEAARLVEVEYEELPAILATDAALAEGAPVLHPDAGSYAFLGGTRSAPPHPNIQGHGVREHGDVEAGFRASFRVYEHTFAVPRTHQGYIEPRAALVWLDGETVRVVTTNKTPFSLRNHMSVSLGIPESRIVVDAGHIGGDFGGKGLSLDEFALYHLARATGRPVRAVTRYADDLQATNSRHAGTITLRTGVDRVGRILAHTSKVVFDGGAYAAGKPVATLMPGDAMLTLAGYRVPAARVEAMTVYTNHVPAGHARAPGQPQNAFAAESHIDLIARDLGIDPLELRERNVVRPGDVDVTGQPWHGTDGAELLARLRGSSRYAPSLAPEGRPNWWGWGVALGVRHVGRGKASLVLRTLPAGRVELRTGVSDQGGGAHTLFQRIVSAELGIGLDRVAVVRRTTDAVPNDPGVGGSRVTPVQGTAALDAARKLKARLAALGRSLEDAGELEVTGEAAQEAHEASMYAYVLAVTVDSETGQTKIEDATLVADVGTVINPVALRGQLEGGFAFGLGQAVMEELRVEDGRVVTANLGDYKLPTIADMPRLGIELMTERPGPGPFGAKSVGELANPAVGAAVANAVQDACGSRVMSLPITAEKIWALLPAKQSR